MNSQDSVLSGKFCLDILRNPIAMTINERTNMDRIISPIWALLFALFLLMALLVYLPIYLSNIIGWDYDLFSYDNPFAWAIVLFAGLSVFIAYILFIILIFLLIDRQNKHFIREKNLRMNIISFLVAANNVAKGQFDISEQLSELYSVDQEANMADRQRSAFGWAIFFFVFPFILSTILSILLYVIVLGMHGHDFFNDFLIILIIAIPGIVLISFIVYVFNFLMNGIYDHDRRWDTFVQNVRSAMHVMGYDIKIMYSRLKLPKRQILFFTLFSILTLGLFLPYWFHILIIDPNNHFKRQWNFEDNFYRAICRK